MDKSYRIEIEKNATPSFILFDFWDWEVYVSDQSYRVASGTAATKERARRKALKAARTIARNHIENRKESFSSNELFHKDAEIPPEENPRLVLERLNRIQIEEWDADFEQGLRKK